MPRAPDAHGYGDGPEKRKKLPTRPKPAAKPRPMLKAKPKGAMGKKKTKKK